MFDRTNRVLLASLLVVGALAGCSKSGDKASGEFCTSIKNRDTLLAVKNIDGDIDLPALEAAVNKIVGEAPDSLKSDTKYLTEVVIAYIKVSQNAMTSQELLKEYPVKEVNEVKARLNDYLKPNCGFTL